MNVVVVLVTWWVGVLYCNLHASSKPPVQYEGDKRTHESSTWQHIPSKRSQGQIARKVHQHKQMKHTYILVCPLKCTHMLGALNGTDVADVSSKISTLEGYWRKGLQLANVLQRKEIQFLENNSHISWLVIHLLSFFVFLQKIVWKRPRHFSYIHLACQTWHSTAGIQWQLCLLNKPGCLSILAHWAPRRAVALWKPCIVFLSCARARFLWRCCVKQRWPSASCKSHVDRPATSPGASPSAAEQPPSPCSVCLFSSCLPPCPFWISLFFLPLHVSLNFLPPFKCFLFLFLLSSLLHLSLPLHA